MKHTAIHTFLVLQCFWCILQAQSDHPVPFDNTSQILAQEIDTYNRWITNSQRFVWGASFGATLDLGLGKRGNSGLRLFASIAVLQNFTEGNTKFMAGIQSEIEIFQGGIGSSELSSEAGKYNIEWRNIPQFMIGGISDGGVYGRPLTPSLGNSMSTLYDPLDYSLSLGTYFITGLNHSRNQQVGFAQAGVKQFYIAYLNDGPPFHPIGLGDSYDRYWTGHLDVGLFWASCDCAVTQLVFRYTRYTGYQENIYELGDRLKLKHLPYKDREQQFFNKGRYQYRVGFYNISNLFFTVYQPRIMGLQRTIHQLFNYPYHANTTGRYFTLGTDFTYRKIYFE